MISLFLVLGFSAALAAPVDVPAIQAEIARQGLDWQAGETRITRMSDEERRHLILPPGEHPLVTALRADPTMVMSSLPPPLRQTLPPAFDWRDHQGFNWLPPARDQGSCGSCWAFSTVGVLESLYAIQHAMHDPTLDLSEQQLLDCAQTTFGCDSGGITWDVDISYLGIRIVGPATYLKETGLTTETCYPYTSGATSTRGTCTELTTLSSQCQNGVIKAGEQTTLMSTFPTDLLGIMDPDFTLDDDAAAEIKGYLQDHPVGTSMRAYNDLSSYVGGIYEPINTTQGHGMHAVVIVGYDDTDGYWIVRNSWGADWGEGGYFRIKYGVSNLGSFSYIYALPPEPSPPAFCNTLPTSLSVDGDHPTVKKDLTIANCGGGSLIWQAILSDTWIVLEDPSGAPVASGAESTAGTTYRVHARTAVGAGESGTLTLTGATNGPRVISITTFGVTPGPDSGGGDPGTHGGGDNDSGVNEDPGQTDTGGCACSAQSPSALFGMLLAIGWLSRRLALRRCR